VLATQTVSTFAAGAVVAAAGLGDGDGDGIGAAGARAMVGVLAAATTCVGSAVGADPVAIPQPLSTPATQQTPTLRSHPGRRMPVAKVSKKTQRWRREERGESSRRLDRARLWQTAGGHHVPEPLGCRFGRVEDADDLAAVHDGDAVGQAHDLLELG
jgi:hypothetical protein